MKLEILGGLSGVDPAEWDALVGDGTPFLEWGWLASLEDSGCVSPETGWQPRHLALRDDAGRIAAACPLYLKSHSAGEFVFDQGWAEAAEGAGIRYYPKLLVASPFTPATGVRFLTRRGDDRPALIRTLGGALREICSQNRLSSVHANFCLPDEVTALAEAGFVERTGYQFQWINPGWETFDDYLAAFRSKRRTQIRREIREPEAQGITIEVLAGEKIPDEVFPSMFRLYKSTIDKLYWARQYLNEPLFDRLRERWKKRLCFAVARREGRVVAGAFNVRKGDVLYGRYWGAFEEHRFLHFNVCYYAGIDYCLRNGIVRFEPGAGGEFKHLRGFDARPTSSMHYMCDERFSRAVLDYLGRERQAVEQRIEWMDVQSELRKTPLT